MEPSSEGEVQDVINVIKERAARYHELKQAADAAEAAKEAVRKELLALASDHSAFFLSALSWTDEAGPISISVYPITKTRYSDALVKLLQARGLGHVMVMRPVVDDNALMVAIRDNRIGLQEVRNLTDISRSYGVRVTRTKAE